MTDQTMRVFLLLCLLSSTIFAADLKDLVSASNDFEVEMIEHEHVLEQFAIKEVLKGDEALTEQVLELVKNQHEY
jgi:hypothetical protein